MCQNLRKPDARLTFGDLAELSNIWLLELDDWVNVFTRQVQTSNKAIQDNNNSIQKLQCLNQRLNLCKLLDEQITHNINYITVRQDVLLQLVLQLESQVLGRGMKGSLSSCVSRKDMYKIVEELSCFITNSKELLEQLAYKCQSDAHSAKADPIYIITRLMEISLELLEQTEMKVFELKKHISFVQHLKQLTLRKLHLKENQLY